MREEEEQAQRLESRTCIRYRTWYRNRNRNRNRYTYSLPVGVGAAAGGGEWTLAATAPSPVRSTQYPVPYGLGIRYGVLVMPDTSRASARAHRKHP